MKLSDALRGAADRAPLDDAAVDLSRATRRASRRRGLHAGANGLMGAGAVALVAVALTGPGGVSLSSADSAEGAGTDTAAIAEDEAVSESAGGAPEFGADGDSAVAAGSSIAWGLCGQTLPGLDASAWPVALTAALGAPDEAFDGDAVAGDALPVTVTSAASADGTFETYGLDGVILWDGYVVGTIDGAPGDAVARELTTLSLASGDETVTALEVPLVDCWEGEPLPAGKYELVMSEELWQVAVAEEPSLEPLDPDEAEDTDADTSGAASEGATGGGADSTVISSAGSRIVAPAIAFAIDGEQVDDPFSRYLGGEPEPEPEPGATSLPDGALDPATARDLYQAGLTGAWDMASGTQRWIKASDSERPEAYTWYGCAYDTDGAFPAESAVMDVLDIGVSAPRAVDLSYGWIVDDNPEVRTSIKNASPWDLYSFWSADSVQLSLVRDGVVVAEAYPVNPVQNGTVIAYGDGEDLAIAGGPDSLGLVGSTGVLASGASIDGLFLWREVNACWSETGQASLTPGTYTLLASHHLAVDGGQTMWAEEDTAWTDDEIAAYEAERLEADAAGESSPFDTGSGLDTGDEWWTGAATSGSAGSSGMTDSVDEPMPDIAVMPEYYAYDAVEFQVWTSLGEVTIR